MSEPLSTEPYKGVRDFYPDDWARLEAMFERAELYEAKTSQEIVNEQTYTFTDRGDRRVTLRPEMTPTLARMVAAKRRELAFPLRWFSIGNRFRYERPQKGRLREFYQSDVDLVGAPEGEADIEVLMVAADIRTAFGAKPSDFIIRMNSRPLLNAACLAAGLKGEAVKRYLHLLDRKAKMEGGTFNATLHALTDLDPLTIIEEASAPPVAHEKAKVLERIEILAKRGVTNAVFDATLTRGFDYYTGMVFEIFDTSIENPRALFGGGRYDGLVALFGGEPIPAVGFAIGDVTLADFITTHKLVLDSATHQPQVYIGTPSPSDIPAAQAFARTLQAQECRIFVNLSEKSLGDQVKDADRRHIPLFIAYGRDEIASGTVRMKQLASGIESAFPASDLPLHLASGS